MVGFETFILLMFAAVILVGISQKIRVPYPLVLVLAGLAIGLIPAKHTMSFDPNNLLVIVLPPILYYSAFGLSFREFKHHWQEIVSLALGLVAFSTLFIGLLFKWIFPEFSWGLAFAFGAIISPPDAVATTQILKRFPLSQRLLTILEGESLINDASAIVLYRLAVAALLSGVFSLAGAAVDFAGKVSVGVVIGVGLGYLMQNFSRRFLDPVVGVLFSFSIPYITYIFADSLGGSGVLAVVSNGFVGAHVLHKHPSSLRRVVGYAAWDIFIILLNCFVFILIGLELSSLTSEMSLSEMLAYAGYACVFTVALVAIRMAWVYVRSSTRYIKALRSRRSEILCPQILREAAVIGWSGMRGIVSLTAALALPFALSNGQPLEGRSEVIFISFFVILLTLLVPGLTLPFLIRRLQICSQPKQDALLEVRKQLSKVAEVAIHHLRSEKSVNQVEYDFLKAYFNLKVVLIEISSTEQKNLENLETAKSRVIQKQRKKLIELWEQFEIDDAVLRIVEHELDLEETHFVRTEIK